MLADFKGPGVVKSEHTFLKWSRRLGAEWSFAQGLESFLDDWSSLEWGLQNSPRAWLFQKLLRY